MDRWIDIVAEYEAEIVTHFYGDHMLIISLQSHTFHLYFCVVLHT